MTDVCYRVCFALGDKNYFLATLMKELEHAGVKCKSILLGMRKCYVLDALVMQDRYFYAQIKKGMLGLK